MDNDVVFGAILAALAAGIASRRARDTVGRLGARGVSSLRGAMGTAVRRARHLLPR